MAAEGQMQKQNLALPAPGTELECCWTGRTESPTGWGEG